MKIFVTGGAGFIGSHVVDKLIESGYEARVYDNLSKGYEEYINKKAEFVKGDLNDFIKVGESIRGCEAVIHLAADSIIGDYMKSPGKFFGKNINNTLNLLESMRLEKINKIVFSSSAAVYGEARCEKVSEDDYKEPINPYGASKLASENLLASYYHGFGINSTSLRYFNVYGTRDDQLPVTRAIPNWMKATMLGRKIKLYWKGEQIRDYIYVKDVASAHIAALENCKGFNVYNLGSGNGNSMMEILEAVFKAVGKRAEIDDLGERKGDPHKLVADISKVEKELGWKPKMNLERGIKETYEFYVSHPISLERI